MANEKHLKILKQGVEAWNRWQEEAWRMADLCRANLRGLNLTGVDLSGTQLMEADLSGSNFRNANFRDANLIGANLSGADLSAASLIKAHLADANLSGAHLTDADLTNGHLAGATFNDTNLRGANLQNIIALNTTFADCDLSEVKGLEFVEHRGPSTVGIDTIYKSKGNIPPSFMRGCGVPEGFITEMHSLVAAVDGIQFYSCFISYSGEDEDFAKRLHGKMRDAHLRVWFAPEDIQGGKKLHEQIETAIRIYDKLLIVLSEASLQSEWVMTEVRKAQSRAAKRQPQALPRAADGLRDAARLGVLRCRQRQRSCHRAARVFHPRLLKLERSRPVRNRLRPPAQRPPRRGARKVIRGLGKGSVGSTESRPTNAPLKNHQQSTINLSHLWQPRTISEKEWR